MECAFGISECRQYGEATRAARGGPKCDGDDGEGVDDILGMLE